MGGKLSSVCITRLMFQALKDARLLIRLSLIRRLEVRGDYVAALKALDVITYKGPFAGLLATYIVRIMILARDGRAFEYVNVVRRFIRDERGELKYRDYCLAYCKYLRRVLGGYPYELAAAEVLSQPSTAFVRKALLVIQLPSTGWRDAGPTRT